MNTSGHNKEHGPKEGLSTSVVGGAKWAAGIVLGAVLLGLGNFIWDQLKPQSFFVSIIVEDESHKALSNASVWLFDVSEVPEKKTSELGLVTFEVPHKYIGKTVAPDIKLDGYIATDSKITLQKNLPTQSIILRKPAAPTVAAAAVPAKPASAERMPVFETKTYSSTPQPSGAGANFSGAYMLCSEDEPEGWTIEKSSFVLTGDRQCGSWSTCSASTQTSAKVCWEYRLQGHSEQLGPFGIGGGTGIQYSAGVLTVLWKHS